MKKLVLLLFFSCCLLRPSLSQQVCDVRITLLTCAPGEELYSIFGHTAIRVQESSKGTDLVYNYGTFEFAPDFYSKFIRGKLLYSLSVESFTDFLFTYQLESRDVVEQELKFDCEEKNGLNQALQVNALEQNRHYRYDFLYDNCTTRAKDIIVKNADSIVVFGNILPKEHPSFRDLIHSYLDKGRQFWSKLGIDILLGVKLDKKVTNQQAMFLPDYLLKGFDHATEGKHPLVSPAVTVLDMPSPLPEKAVFTPAVVFTILLLLVLVLTFLKRKWTRKFMVIFDFIFFMVLGLAGFLLLFMWFGTDHIVCRNNYNLFWALPLHFVAAFFIASRPPWLSKYFRIVFWLTLVLLAAWLFLPQQMNAALIPVLILIVYRSWSLSRK